MVKDTTPIGLVESIKDNIESIGPLFGSTFGGIAAALGVGLGNAALVGLGGLIAALGVAFFVVVGNRRSGKGVF